MCPAGTGAFLFLLFGPPARRAADGGLLGAAAPPRPPLHSPRTTPLGLSSIPTPTGRPLRAFLFPSVHEGCTAFAPGASSLRSVISLRAAQCQHTPPRWMRGREASGLLQDVAEMTLDCQRSSVWPKDFSCGQIVTTLPLPHLNATTNASRALPAHSKTSPKVQAPTTTNISPTITVIFETPCSQAEALRPLMQRESAHWHCAARREITERSEEAPGAKAAQPSQNGEIWKTLKG